MEDVPKTRKELAEFRQEVCAFFEQTGAVALFCEIHWADGNRFTELAEAMGVSTSTVSRRLEEAVDLQILKVTLESTDYGTNKLYKLTKAGTHIRQILEQTGVKDAYLRLREVEREFDSAVGRAQTEIDNSMYQ